MLKYKSLVFTYLVLRGKWYNWSNIQGSCLQTLGLQLLVASLQLVAQLHTNFTHGKQLTYTKHINICLRQCTPGFSLVCRPLPDFILQWWKKSGEGPVPSPHHRPEMVDWFVCNVDMVSWWWQYAHAICSWFSKRSNSQVCLDILPTATNFASTKLLFRVIW